MFARLADQGRPVHDPVVQGDQPEVHHQSDHEDEEDDQGEGDALRRRHVLRVVDVADRRAHDQRAHQRVGRERDNVVEDQLPVKPPPR